MAKEEPIQLTRDEWKLYEQAAHKLTLVNERDERAWHTLQERHHENYRQQRRAVAAKLQLAGSPNVVAQLEREDLLRTGDIEGE